MRPRANTTAHLQDQLHSWEPQGFRISPDIKPFRSHDHYHPQAFKLLHPFHVPQQPQRQQQPTISPQYRGSFSKATCCTHHQTSSSPVPVLLHHHAINNHTRMDSPLFGPMDTGNMVPSKDEGQDVLLDPFLDGLHAGADDHFDVVHQPRMIDNDPSGFPHMPDDFYGSSYSSSSPAGSVSSTYGAPVTDLAASFGGQVGQEAPRSLPHTHLNYQPPHSFSTPWPDDHNAYEPSLPVSPQAVFPAYAGNVAYTPSPVLSAQEGYESSNNSFGRYRSESPMPSGLSDFQLSDSVLNTPPPTSHWWPPHGNAYAPPGYGSPTSAFAPFHGVRDRDIAPHNHLFPDARDRDSAYAPTDADDTASQDGSQAAQEREEQNRFLLAARKAGMSYRDIREQGNFREAESTLRGRFRDLTKRKDQRVRKPAWTRRDTTLLTRIVDDLLGLTYHTFPNRREKNEAIARALARVPWKRVSSYIVENGGSYRFGNATCKKKYMQLAGLL